jgi:hypothetical protein
MGLVEILLAADMTLIVRQSADVLLEMKEFVFAGALGVVTRWKLILFLSELVIHDTWSRVTVSICYLRRHITCWLFPLKK